MRTADRKHCGAALANSGRVWGKLGAAAGRSMLLRGRKDVPNR